MNQSPHDRHWLGLSIAFWHVVACLALAVLTAATFSNALSNGFVSFDDWFLVEDNPRIHSLAWGNVARMFTHQSSGTWLPLRLLSYAVDYRLWGLLPLGYHLTNVAFHMANVLLAYAVLSWLLRRPALALLGAAWFAVHPVQVESVTWVSGRRDVQYAFFFLLSLLAFLASERREGRSRWVFYGLSLACLLASLLSKAAAMTLPGVLVLAVLLFGTEGDTTRRRLLATVPHWVLAVGIALVHYLVARSAEVVKEPAFTSGVANLPLVFGKYWQLLLFPVHLATPHGYGALQWSDPAPGILLSAAVVVVVALAWWAAPRKHVALFCAGWWFLLLLPVSNLLPLSVLVAERYMYLPVLGACALGADIVGSLASRRRAVVIACAVGVLALLAAATYHRNRVWENGKTFWKDSVSRWPGMPVARIGLACEYREGNQLEKSWRQYMMIALAGGRAASRGDEHVKLVSTGLERCYERLAREREAEGRKAATLDVYETVVRLMPQKIEPRVRLAQAYERMGMPAKAREQVLAIQGMAPEHPGLAEWLRRLEEAPEDVGGQAQKE